MDVVLQHTFGVGLPDELHDVLRDEVTSSCVVDDALPFQYIMRDRPQIMIL